MWAKFYIPADVLQNSSSTAVGHAEAFIIRLCVAYLLHTRQACTGME